MENNRGIDQWPVKTKAAGEVGRMSDGPFIGESLSGWPSSTATCAPTSASRAAQIFSLGPLYQAASLWST